MLNISWEEKLNRAFFAHIFRENGKLYQNTYRMKFGPILKENISPEEYKEMALTVSSKFTCKIRSIWFFFSTIIQHTLSLTLSNNTNLPLARGHSVETFGVNKASSNVDFSLITFNISFAFRSPVILNNNIFFPILKQITKFKFQVNRIN